MRITDRAKGVLDRVLEAFETGAVPEAIARSVLPAFDVPSSRWSLNNRILMCFAGTADARGIRQWRAVGRWPRKGCKACYILAPLYVNKADRDAETGEETEHRIFTGFKCCPVFRIEDTEGRPIQYPDLHPPEPPPLADVARTWGIQVKYLPGNGGCYGYYQPGGNRIGLCTHDLSTFFHELGHAAHDRLGALRTSSKWEQEVVAELTAAVLSHLYGAQPDDGGAYRYIRRHAAQAGRDVYAACMSVIADVEKCLGMVLNQAGYPNRADAAAAD